MHGSPAWVTVNVWPATVSMPFRAAPVGFPATVNAAVPDPLPLAPDVIVIQDAVLAAVQAQPSIVVTAIGVPGPPAAPMDSEVAEI